MKSTESFEKTITAHLELRAMQDPLFAITYKKENKNISDCVTYILNEVQKSGCSAFLPSEIFNMAVHYYDEDDIVVGKKVSGVKIVDSSKSSAESKPTTIAKVTKPKAPVKPQGPKPGEQINMF
jgi:hypothetical protein